MEHTYALQRMRMDFLHQNLFYMSHLIRQTFHSLKQSIFSNKIEVIFSKQRLKIFLDWKLENVSV